MTSSLRPAQVLGYASLSPNGSLSFVDCRVLQDFSENVTTEMEILAEEFHPSERRRPCFNELRKLIAQGAAKVVVVPSLFHIAAGERARLLKFLNFLEINNVRLMSLKEGVDSDLLDKESILFAAARNSSPQRGKFDTPPQIETELTRKSRRA